MFSGSHVAIVTPFKNGKFDEKDLLLAETLAQDGVVDFTLDKYILPN